MKYVHFAGQRRPISEEVYSQIEKSIANPEVGNLISFQDSFAYDFVVPATQIDGLEETNDDGNWVLSSKSTRYDENIHKKVSRYNDALRFLKLAKESLSHDEQEYKDKIHEMHRFMADRVHRLRTTGSEVEHHNA
jgi:hypothetical protein